MTDKLTVLHLFGSFPAPTETWSRGIITALPHTQNTIASEVFLKSNGYDAAFEYVEFPVLMGPADRRTVFDKVHDRFARIMRRALPRYIASHAGPVDVVHAHFGNIGWKYRRLKRNLAAPLAVSFYGYDYSRYPKADPSWRARYLELFDEGDVFLVEGPAAGAQLEALGCPAGKIRIQHLGVDTKLIEVPQRRRPPGALRLLQVATFEEKKGHQFTIEAFLRASAICPGITLTLVGAEGRSRIKERMLKVVSASQTRAQIQFVDRIDYGGLHQFMANFDVFIQPSCHAKDGDCEGGAPIALLDAQATGMPVIATTHCDIPEEVVDGQTGVLVPERDIDALVRTIVKFAAMGPDELAKFQRNARAHVEREFDVSISAGRLRETYEEILRAARG